MASTSRWKKLLGALALVLSNVAIAAPSITPLFFQVDYQGKTAWVLGSFHVGKADFYPLPTQIDQAFKHASALVLEADVQDPQMSLWVQQYGMHPLKADIETQKMLDEYCLPLAICQQLAQFSPWLQSVQISMLRLASMGLSPQFGVEQQLLNLKGNKPLLQLETAKGQLQMLAAFDETTQWAMVRDSIQAPATDIQALVTAWQRGDRHTIAKLTQEQLQAQGGEMMLDKMLWQRNRQMAQRLQQLLQQQPKPLFVAVGSAHLAGAHNLLDYLQQAGAQVRNCWQTSCDISTDGSAFLPEKMNITPQ